VRILALSTAIPFPPISGGKLRTFHLLRALARRHDVTLAGFTYGEVFCDPPYSARIETIPWNAPPLYQQMNQGDAVSSQAAADRLDAESAEPWCVSWAESAEFAALVQDLVRDPFDLVLLEGTPMARFLPLLPPEIPKVLDFMDVYSRMTRRQLDTVSEGELASARRELERTVRFERDAGTQCDLCLTVSEEEAQAVRRQLGIEHTAIVPNGVDTEYFTASHEETEHANLLFTGAMSYRPNSEAVIGFVREVLPTILRAIPEARFHCVGAAPPREVKALANRNVIVHGFVPDMRPFHQRASVVVVPLARGGGTKLKVLEAAAMGKAIVTTSIGAEGLSFRDNEELIVADSAVDFAQAVVHLVNDVAKCRALGQRARQVAMQYDWEIIGDRLCRLVESLALKCRTLSAGVLGTS
jgi:sugar transferase (PEP-CTERM/EpsH1 system associated)